LREQLVESPQPASNPSHTQNPNQLFLQKVFIDEVAGPAFLLLKIRKLILGRNETILRQIIH
jgi:hypothetical protein